MVPHIALTMALNRLDKPMVTMMTEMIGSPIMGRKIKRSISTPIRAASSTATSPSSTFGRRIKPFGVEAVLSGDEYGTWDWKTHRLIEWEAPNIDCGYPSSAQLEDGTIVTLYYKVTADQATPGLAGHVQAWCARYRESDLTTP